MRIVLRFYSKGKMRKYFSTSLRRMLYKINHIQFEKAYLKVNYGKSLATNGKMMNFYNDGWYTNKKELIQVAKIFWYEG